MAASRVSCASVETALGRIRPIGPWPQIAFAPAIALPFNQWLQAYLLFAPLTKKTTARAQRLAVSLTTSARGHLHRERFLKKLQHYVLREVRVAGRREVDADTAYDMFEVSV